MAEHPADGAQNRADVAETHTAILFFAGDRVYKVKKSVDLGFLDHTSVEARRASCEREVTLNRRFAPDVYLGLGEFRGPRGEAAEPVVVMRRMPRTRRLSNLVTAGAPVDEELRLIARELASCHAGARRDAEVAAEGTRDAVLHRWADGFVQVGKLVAPDRVVAAMAEAEELVGRYLAGREALFDSRIAQGRVVDGHGDLLAQDVFCLKDGPRVLDCLDFDDLLRYVDGLDDAAFLAMDLERLGAPRAGQTFLAWYREYSADPAPPSLWHHYIAYRAFVRAKVALVQAEQGAPGADAEADRLSALMVRHLRQATVRIVLVGGLPGSGKTTVAGALADRLGATLLSTDRLRKEIVGLAPEQSARAAYGTGIYTPEQRNLTYEVLLGRTEALLAAGESVVLDASWTSAAHRDGAAEVARRTTSDLVALRCQVPNELATERLANRGPGPSDADTDVARAMAAHADPWPQATSLATTAPLSSVVRTALAAVLPQADEVEQTVRLPYMAPD